MAPQKSPSARQYRRCAEEVRAIAAQDDYHVTRGALLIVANSYDMMAATLEYSGLISGADELV